MTGGYVPKKIRLPPKDGDFGGIYLGDEDDEVGDEHLDDFDLCCHDMNDMNAAGSSLTTRSVDDNLQLGSPSSTKMDVLGVP